MWWLSLVPVLSCLTVTAAQPQDPVLVVGAELETEMSVRLITDEPVVRPPRRPDDPLYRCRASIRSFPSREQPFAGELQIVMFSGESETTTAELAPGIRAELTCAIDATVPKAGVRLLVSSNAARQLLLSSTSTFWLPEATE